MVFCNAASKNNSDRYRAGPTLIKEYFHACYINLWHKNISDRVICMMHLLICPISLGNFQSRGLTCKLFAWSLSHTYVCDHVYMCVWIYRHVHSNMLKCYQSVVKRALKDTDIWFELWSNLRCTKQFATKICTHSEILIDTIVDFAAPGVECSTLAYILSLIEICGCLT